MTVLLVLYPTVMVLGRYLTPFLEDDLGLPTSVAVLVQLAVAVSILTWVLIPFARRLLRNWLHARPGASTAQEWLVPIGLVGLCLAMAAVLANG